MRIIELDAIPSQTETINLDGVCVLAITQLDLVADLAANLRTAPHGRCIELSKFAFELGFVGLNCGLYQRHIGVLASKMLTLRCQPVQPADIKLPALDFWAIQQVHEE